VTRSMFSCTVLWISLCCPAHAQFGAGIIEQPPAPVVVWPTSGSLVSVRLDEGSERIEEVLATRDEWNFGQQSLSDVAEQIRKRFSVAVQIDLANLELEGVDAAAPIPWPAGTLQLQTVLRIGLSPQGLGLHVENGLLILTTQTKCDGTFLNRIYAVRDQDLNGPCFDDGGLIPLTERFMSGWWNLQEGVGGTILPGPVPHSLIARNTWSSHRELEQLIRGLRRAREEQQLPVFRTEAFDQSFQSIDEGVQRLDKVLATRDDWRFGDSSPREMVEFLRQRFEVPVHLDVTALQDEGVEPDQKLTWVAGPMTLETLLTTGLQTKGLGVDREEDLLLITTQAKQAELMVNRIFPVADLLPGEYDHPGSYDSLIQMIEQTASGPWENRHEGMCGSIAPWPAARSIIVRHDRKVQREVAELLHGIRRSLGLEQSTNSKQEATIQVSKPPAAGHDPPVAMYLHEDDERIEQVLATVDNWNFGTVPVGKLADDIHQRFQIPVKVSKAELREERIDPEMPIEWTRGNVSLEALLRHGLNPHDMHFYVDDGVLLISPSGCDDLLHTRLYPIADLTRAQGFAEDAKQVVSILQGTVSGMWEDIDGVGGTATIISVSKSVLVRQTRTAHLEIEQALRMLRKAQAVQRLPVDAPEPVSIPANPMSGPLPSQPIFLRPPCVNQVR